jgi:hypothetical protein
LRPHTRAERGLLQVIVGTFQVIVGADSPVVLKLEMSRVIVHRSEWCHSSQSPRERQAEEGKKEKGKKRIEFNRDVQDEQDDKGMTKE